MTTIAGKMVEMSVKLVRMLPSTITMVKMTPGVISLAKSLRIVRILA